MGEQLVLDLELAESDLFPRKHQEQKTTIVGQAGPVHADPLRPGPLHQFHVVLINACWRGADLEVDDRFPLRVGQIGLRAKAQTRTALAGLAEPPNSGQREYTDGAGSRVLSPAIYLAFPHIARLQSLQHDVVSAVAFHHRHIRGSLVLRGRSSLRLQK